MTVDRRKQVVGAGYDAITDRYAAWAERVEGDPRDRFISDLVGRLPPGARVLDLGCGAGIPSTRELARHFEVVGVDISREQLARARNNVPDATFVEADLCSVGFPADSFDAVTAFYVIAGWLKPGGWFLTTLCRCSQRR